MTNDSQNTLNGRREGGSGRDQPSAQNPLHLAERNPEHLGNLANRIPYFTQVRCGPSVRADQRVRRRPGIDRRAGRCLRNRRQPTPIGAELSPPEPGACSAK
jgi:hypothetical protein